MAYSVNLIPNREFAVIHLNQYEYGVGNTRTVAIYNGDVPFDIPSGSDITIEGVKPDGNAFAYDEGITFEDNEVTFELKDQMTVLAGQFPVEIVIRNSQGRWSTKNLIFDVEAGPVNENTPVSDEDIPAYIELAQRNANRAVSAAETATSAATTATNAANTATSKASIATTAATTATTAANTATSKASTATTAASTATTAAANAKVSEDNAKDSEIIAKTAADDVRPIITEVGNIVTTENAKPEKLFYLKADLEPKQDFNGYDHPWVGGAGKNLLTNNMQSVTKNGITVTRNSDGSFTFNGTATANVGFYIAAENSSAQTILPIKPGTYTLSGGASGGSGSTYRLAVYTYVDGTYTHAYADFGSSRTFTISEDENGYIPLINIYNGTTVNNLTFKPQLEAGETATEYEPYSNICPISGYTGLTVTRAGKNLLPNTGAATTTSAGVTYTKHSDGSVTASGTATGTSTYRFVTAADRFTLKAGTYRISGITPSSDISITWRATDGTSGFWYDADNEFTLTADKTYEFIALRFQSGAVVSNVTVYPMIRPASVADATYEPYNGATYPVTFPTEVGTVYGGHVEVYENGTGKLVVNQAVKIFNGTESGWSMASATHHVAIRTLTPNPDPAMIWSDDHATSGKIITTNGVTPCFHHYATLRSVWPSCCIRISNNGLYLTIGEEYETIDEIKAWLGEHPFQIAYYIEPVTYDLTNQQVVQMLDDRNVVWMDANGQIEISFRNNSKLNEYLDIVSGVQYSDITQAGTVTEVGTKVVDAVQLNPNVNGSIAKRLGQVETVAADAIPKTNISRATNVASTGSKVVDAYELNASKSGTLAKKIATNTTNITKNTTALGGFSFGTTSDGKPGYKAPGADSVTPFKTGGIDILGTATGTFSQNTVFTLATDVDLSEYSFLGALEKGSGTSHPYNLMEYSIGTVKRYRTHYQSEATGTDPSPQAAPEFSILISVVDMTDTVTISVKNINNNAFAGTITLYGFKGEIET